MMTRELRPEVLPPQERDVEPWVEKLVWYMENSIRLPGGRSMGIDGVVGLIPGLGDALTTLAGALIIVAAARSGIPKVTVARMVANTGLDMLVGAIPFLGDLFDIAFKANTRNLRIYREALQGRRSRRRDWTFLLALGAVLALLIAIPFVVLAVVLSYF